MLVVVSNRPASFPGWPGRPFQETHLSLAESLRFVETTTGLPQPVQLPHQQGGALVCHLPKRRHHRLGSLTLSQYREAFDLSAVASNAADRRIAGGKGQQVDAPKKTLASR